MARVAGSAGGARLALVVLGLALPGALGCPQDIRPDPGLASTSGSSSGSSDTGSTGSTSATSTTGSTGSTSSTGGTGTVGSTGSTGGASSGSTGVPSASLDGGLAYPVGSAWGYLEQYPDGGNDEHRVTIEINDGLLACFDSSDVPYRFVRLIITRFPTDSRLPVLPGTYTIYNPYQQPLSGTSATLTYLEGDGQGQYGTSWRGQSGTLQLDHRDLFRFTGSFSAVVARVDGGEPQPLSGTFDVAHCFP